MGNVMFAVRGDNLNARFSRSGKVPGLYTATTPAAVVAGSQAGLIGPSYIDLYKNNASRRALLYPGGKNFSTNPGISILMRCSFVDNDAIQGLWQIGGPWQTITPHGMYLFYVSGQLRIALYDETGTAVGNGFGTGLDNYTIGSFTPVVGQFYDILVTSTGVISTTGFTVYVDGNIIGQAQLASNIQNPRDVNLMTHISIGCAAFDVNAPYTYLNEFVVFDAAINPASVALESGTGALNGFQRTSFVAAAAFDGTANIDPGVANVANSTAYEIDGIAKTGTYAPPVSTDPGVDNVLSPTAYEINGAAKVGTLITGSQALESDVRKGVKYNDGSKTGTYDVYSANTDNTDTDVVSIAQEALGNFLTNSIAGLKVLDEWPYGNQQLTYPSLTMTCGQAKRMPLMPETTSVTDPDDDNKVIATEVVAEYDFSIQLDLWCRNKLERKQNLAKLLTLFNSQEVDVTGANNPDGLTLTLANYHNMPVRYEIDTHKHKDDEQAAQRQERRELIMVIVNLREIRTRTYYAMRNVETHTAVGSDDSSQDNPDTTAL